MLWCCCEHGAPPEVVVPALNIGRLLEWEFQTGANGLVTQDPLQTLNQSLAQNFMRRWDQWPFPPTVAWTRRGWGLEITQITHGGVNNLSIEMTGVTPPTLGGLTYPADPMEIYYQVGNVGDNYDRSALVGPFNWNPSGNVNFGGPGDLTITGLDTIVNAALSDPGYTGSLRLIWSPQTIWVNRDQGGVPPTGWELGVDGTLTYNPA